MTEPWRSLCESLDRHKGAYEASCELAGYTTFRLGGPAPLVVSCGQPDALCCVTELTAAAGVPVRLIGGGSNLLISRHGLSECIVRYVAEGNAAKPVIAGDAWELDASLPFDTIGRLAAEHGVAGLINASGIPGTIGGAVVGNAGAFGWQVGDALQSVDLLEPSGARVTATPRELGFSYRHSALRDSGRAVLRIRLHAPSTLSREQGQAERQRILGLRAEKHPNLQRDPCAGSFFRNIEPTSAAGRRQAAGHFLEEVGAKEMSVGGAAVFPKHANILIKKRPDCTAEDVWKLSEQMANAVEERFGFRLVREVRAVGL